jgi:O-antigen ligase
MRGADQSRALSPVSTSAAFARAAPARRKEPAGVRRPLRWAFAIFVASIPFEAVDTGFERFTYSKFAGYALLLVALFYPRTALRRFPMAGWCFALYLLVFICMMPFQPPVLLDEIRSRLFRLVQMLVLFWISYNLLRHRRMAGLMLWSFATACSVLAVLNILGFFTESAASQGGERASAFGRDANNVAAMFSVGVLAMAGLLHGRMRKGRARNLVAWVMLPAVAVAIARTGSRGSFAALVAGLLIFLFAKEGPGTRARNLVLVVVALSILTFATLSLEMNRTRWEMTLEHGTMAGRENIYPAAWKLFLEKPITGWGPATHHHVLGARFVRDTLDTHNLFLWLLTEVGLLGSIPYFVGLLFCVRSAWRARAGPYGVLPMAMVVSGLIINLSLTWHERKVFWLILALTVAGASPIGVRAVRRLRQGSRAPRMTVAESVSTAR